MIYILYEKKGLSGLSIIFLSHSAKNFVGNPFGVSENFGHRRSFRIRGGGGEGSKWVLRFSEKNLYDNTGIFRRGTLLCCVSENFRSRKGSFDKRGEGERRNIKISAENFLSHSAEKFRRGSLPGFKKILVSKIFMHGRGGALSCFSVVIFKLKNIGKAGIRIRDYCFRTMLSYPLCHGNYWNVISDKCQWNHKNIWRGRDSNPDLPLQNLLVLTPLLSFIIE